MDATVMLSFFQRVQRQCQMILKRVKAVEDPVDPNGTYFSPMMLRLRL